MVDHARLNIVLTEFAHTLVRRYEVGEVLYQLADRTVEVLGIAGAGVSLQDDSGKLHFVSASDEDASLVERVQEDYQEGPCHESHRRGEPILVDDISICDQWPNYRDQARAVGYRAVAGIPMHLDSFRLGALNVYDRRVREWTQDEVAAAQALADVASSLVINARQLEQSRRVAEQLQHALDSRVVIEQAKGAIARERSITVDEAFGLLRAHARSRNAKLHDVARGVLDQTLRLD
jgi:GAF domain-containing protein